MQNKPDQVVTTATLLNNGLAVFNTPAHPDEYNLIAACRQMLVEAGLAQLLPDNYDNDPLILQSRGRIVSVQRWFLNRYWLLQLVHTPVNSMNVRPYLSPSAEPDEWLRIFGQFVMPFVLENDLPLKVPHTHVG